MQKYVVREKSCNYFKNVNFNRKIKGVLNRKGEKSSREKKMSFLLLAFLLFGSLAFTSRQVN